MFDDVDEVGVLAGDIGPAAAVDELGAAGAGEPADHRPFAYLRFGDEDLRGGGGEDGDVDVADVVARHDAGARARFALDDETDAQGPQDEAADPVQPERAAAET